jgi:hypothetical protein
MTFLVTLYLFIVASMPAPFQGKRTFCSAFKPVQYEVSVKGNAVLMYYVYKNDKQKITGIYRNGKLYTDDPDERTYNMRGKYYVLTKNSLRRNNLEGGDYVEYAICTNNK